MLNEKSGYGKKVKLTIVLENEDLEKLIQTKKIVKKEERGRKEVERNPWPLALLDKAREKNKLVSLYTRGKRQEWVMLTQTLLKSHIKSLIL